MTKVGRYLPDKRSFLLALENSFDGADFYKPIVTRVSNPTGGANGGDGGRWETFIPQLVVSRFQAYSPSRAHFMLN